MSGAVVGAEVGAEIGALSGPLGAAAGAVIGLIVGGLATLGLGEAIKNANTKADSTLRKETTSEPCADCGDGPDCFEPPEGANPDEMARQLQEQEDEINKLSPDEMLDRLADGDRRWEETRSYRGPGDAARRMEARGAVEQRAYDEALDNFVGSREDALRHAERAGEAALEGKDATHALDWIAGGDGTVSGMGDRSVNRSIGKQWGTERRGSELTRRKQLRKAAEKAKSQGKSKMDIDLEEC